MSTRTVTKKRKSADGNTMAAKKVKTAKSAEKPAPLKSALKKTKATAIVADDNNNADGVEAIKKKTAPQNTTKTRSTDLTPDQTAALLAGFSSDEEGSASEDNDEGIAISTLPKAPTIAAVQNRIKGATKTNTTDPESTPGVVYIGRIPHGFYEHQLRSYFSQFGDITHLRLMRNRKTGRSQHYGFIEFASSSVADIVAKTMDKYLLFNHILQVRRVPREQVNEKMWLRSSRRARNVAPRNRLEGRKLRMGATREVWEGRVEREKEKRREKEAKLREMGYEFEMPAVKAVGEVPVKPKAVEEGKGGVAVDGLPVVEEAAPAPTAFDINVEETVSKKRPASGKTQTKKAVKKVKA